MPRGRSPNREKAFELWKKSDGKRLLRDIAEELGVSETMVRKWKNQDGWESAALPNKPETLPNKTAGNGNVTKRKPAAKGAPKGNQNAAGHGAPKGNQNHYVHGLYANPTFDMIPAEELQRLRQIDYTDEEALIIDEVILLTSRERQLLETIQKYQDAKNGLSLDGVTRRQPVKAGGDYHPHAGCLQRHPKAASRIDQGAEGEAAIPQRAAHPARPEGPDAERGQHT